jgi:hypothetical protein
MKDVGKFYGLWSILWTFGINFGHVVYFVVIWCTFSLFGMLYREKSGNPGPKLTIMHVRKFAQTGHPACQQYKCAW